MTRRGGVDVTLQQLLQVSLPLLLLLQLLLRSPAVLAVHLNPAAGEGAPSSLFPERPPSLPEFEASAYSSVEGPPLIRGWAKQPAAACTLQTLGRKAPQLGPFPALLTFRSDGRIAAFEPVPVQTLCPLAGEPEALLKVVCSDTEAAAAAAAGGGRAGGGPWPAVSRPAADLTYRLTFEENQISGLLPNLVASSLKTFLARKEFKGTNTIVLMLRWMAERKKNKEEYQLACEATLRRVQGPLHSQRLTNDIQGSGV
ncbi:hypothetical protein Efla_002061 [Eimeria flavescens]